MKIKFRGKRLDNGEYVYGDFLHSVPMSSFTGIIDEDGFVHEIKPDSQKQLVGYDSNGVEVYEDDTLIGEEGIKKYDYVALYQPMVYWKRFDNDKAVDDIPRVARTIPLNFAKRYTPMYLKEKKS